MPRSTLVPCLFLIVLGGVFSGVAAADPPEEFQLAIAIHTDAQDPNSPTALRLTFMLDRAEFGGGQIGWRVQSIVFRRTVTGGGDDVWVEDKPVVDSPDGLWWIAHADVDAPLLSEFTQIPFMSGIANNEAPAGDELAYEMQGMSEPAPPEPAPWPVTAILSYDLALAPTNEPVIPPGSDEPVEVPDEPPMPL